MSKFSFTLAATDGSARTGRIETIHGAIQTPAFMPVGTAAAVKAMTPEAVAETGAEIILANTYHLMLRPGAERIGRLGGVRKFMNWPGPLLTDSGGFQVMSLAKLRTISDAGVTFQSHLDGSRHELTPERAIEIQRHLDSTIAMVLDECLAYPATEAEAAASMARSMAWAARSKAAYGAPSGYGLFGIVQGGVYGNLRADSAGALCDMGFDGYAIGGLAVGEGQAMMFETVAATVPHLPADKPRYLMGVGKPDDLVGAVGLGVDMFDCVLPTRSGRTAQAFTARGTVNLRNARHADDPRPLDATCPCPACRHYSRAYLHHLAKANEILASTLLSWHNITYYQLLMAGMRDAIAAQAFAAFARDFAEQQARGDIEPL
jgi:queuine tRNA-ribosyltransferase